MGPPSLPSSHQLSHAELCRNVGLDTRSGSSPRGYMVTNSCTFHGSAAYPNVYMAGFAVDKVGTTSGAVTIVSMR